MANKLLLGTIASLIGIAPLSGFLASTMFTGDLVANDAAVAENNIAAEQADVEPSIEADQSIEPNTADEQATGLDTKLQAAEESSTAKDRDIRPATAEEEPDTRPATAEEEAEIRRIAEKNGMVVTPHGDGFDVEPQ
jgi:hypothetical protein